MRLRGPCDPRPFSPEETSANLHFPSPLGNAPHEFNRKLVPDATSFSANVTPNVSILAISQKKCFFFLGVFLGINGSGDDLCLLLVSEGIITSSHSHLHPFAFLPFLRIPDFHLQRFKLFWTSISVSADSRSLLTSSDFRSCRMMKSMPFTPKTVGSDRNTSSPMPCTPWHFAIFIYFLFIFSYCIVLCRKDELPDTPMPMQMPTMPQVVLPSHWCSKPAHCDCCSLWSTRWWQPTDRWPN